MNDPLLVMQSGPAVPTFSGKDVKQLVVFMHGVGADGNDLISLASVFGPTLPDAIFISPHAPFAYDGAPYGQQWFSLAGFVPGEQPSNDCRKSLLSGAQATMPVVDAFITSALEQLGLGLKDLILIGFSQGTMMALHWALRQKEAIAGVVGYSGALISSSTIAEDITAKPPVMLIHGSMDPVVPYSAMADAEKALRDCGVNVQAITCPYLGHGIDDAGVDAARTFLSCLVRN